MIMQIARLRNVIIGRVEDGGVQTVEIDCTEWLRAYPNLTNYRIEVITPDGLVYPPVVHMDGDLLVWPITQSDTATKGKGMYQVVATGADGEKKTSDHPDLIVLSTIPGTAGDEIPEASRSWVDEVVEAAQRAEDAARRAESAKPEANPDDIAKAVNDYMAENPVEITAASAEKLGGVRVGPNLKINENGVLSVDTADAVEEDNTRPITAAAVHTTVGNIEILLGTI